MKLGTEKDPGVELGSAKKGRITGKKTDVELRSGNKLSGKNPDVELGFGKKLVRIV